MLLALASPVAEIDLSFRDLSLSWDDIGMRHAFGDSTFVYTFSR